MILEESKCNLRGEWGNKEGKNKKDDQDFNTVLSIQ